MFANGRSLVLVALALTVVLVAPAAYAEWGQDGPDPLYPPPSPYDPCFDTGDCWDDAAKPPVTFDCIARQSAEEECRQCDYSLELRMWKCASVPWDSNCECDMTKGCTGKKSCRYIW